MVWDGDPHGLLVERIYDIVVAPDRLEALVDTWSQRLSAHRAAADGFLLLGGDALLPHVERAEFVLQSLFDATQLPAAPSAQSWVGAVRSAAVVVTRSGRVVAANGSAVSQLRLEAGGDLATIALAAEDQKSLLAEVATTRELKAGQSHILRFRSANHAQPFVMRIVEAIGGDRNHVGILTTVVAWREGLNALVQTTFDLTAAEASVLQQLTLGLAVKEIAKETGRSVETIRSHVTALLTKTETRSQIELVRMTLGLLEVVDDEPVDPPATTAIFVSASGQDRSRRSRRRASSPL